MMKKIMKVRHNPEVFRVCDVKDLDNYIDRIEEMIERKREFIKRKL